MSMEEKWIPTLERLPNQVEFIESYVRSEYAAEFLVTIEGEPYKVVAWMPLPEVFKG